MHYLQTLVRDYPIVSLEDVASDVDRHGVRLHRRFIRSADCG